MKIRYYLKTFGCQMNKNDSEKLHALFRRRGFCESLDWKTADVAVLNSCSVRDKAERRVIGFCHEINHFRITHNKPIKIALTGCMPQYQADTLLRKYPFIDFITGVNNMEDLPGLFTGNDTKEKQLTAIIQTRSEKSIQRYENDFFDTHRETQDNAWVTIMFGCNNFCTYCIVPHTRGREQSRKKEDILNEIKQCADQGYTQITLLGQNVNGYGKGLYQNYFFPELLIEISGQFPELQKINFITSHPKDITNELIAVIRDNARISRDIHFPMQHGDSRILRAMNRGYTAEEYLTKVSYIRKNIPGVRIGTDLIVGFPGETEEAFNNMLNMCRIIRFDFFNTAAFSPRSGTKASEMSDQVDEKTKKERLAVLNELLDKITRSV